MFIEVWVFILLIILGLLLLYIAILTTRHLIASFFEDSPVSSEKIPESIWSRCNGMYIHNKSLSWHTIASDLHKEKEEPVPHVECPLECKSAGHSPLSRTQYMFVCLVSLMTVCSAFQITEKQNVIRLDSPNKTTFSQAGSIFYDFEYNPPIEYDKNWQDHLEWCTLSWCMSTTKNYLYFTESINETYQIWPYMTKRADVALGKSNLSFTGYDIRDLYGLGEDYKMVWPINKTMDERGAFKDNSVVFQAVPVVVWDCIKLDCSGRRDRFSIPSPMGIQMVLDIELGIGIDMNYRYTPEQRTELPKKTYLKLNNRGNYTTYVSKLVMNIIGVVVLAVTPNNWYQVNIAVRLPRSVPWDVWGGRKQVIHCTGFAFIYTEMTCQAPDYEGAIDNLHKSFKNINQGTENQRRHTHITSQQVYAEHTRLVDETEDAQTVVLTVQVWAMFRTAVKKWQNNMHLSKMEEIRISEERATRNRDLVDLSNAKGGVYKGQVTSLLVTEALKQFPHVTRDEIISSDLCTMSVDFVYNNTHTEYRSFTECYDNFTRINAIAIQQPGYCIMKSDDCFCQQGGYMIYDPEQKKAAFMLEREFSSFVYPYRGITMHPWFDLIIEYQIGVLLRDDTSLSPLISCPSNYIAITKDLILIHCVSCFIDGVAFTDQISVLHRNTSHILKIGELTQLFSAAAVSKTIRIYTEGKLWEMNDIGITISDMPQQSSVNLDAKTDDINRINMLAKSSDIRGNIVKQGIYETAQEIYKDHTAWDETKGRWKLVFKLSFSFFSITSIILIIIIVIILCVVCKVVVRHVSTPNKGTDKSQWIKPGSGESTKIYGLLLESGIFIDTELVGEKVIRWMIAVDRISPPCTKKHIKFLLVDADNLVVYYNPSNTVDVDMYDYFINYTDGKMGGNFIEGCLVLETPEGKLSFSPEQTTAIRSAVTRWYDVDTGAVVADGQSHYGQLDDLPPDDESDNQSLLDF